MSNPTRAILAVDDEIDADELVALFGGDESLRLTHVLTRFDDVDRTLEEAQSDVLVVAADGYSDRALFIIEHAVELAPDRPVLVLGRGSPSGFVRRVLELGADDILLLPQSPAQVHFAIQKVLARRSRGLASTSDRARVITVLGPKGGTGKTLTSANLAVALAQRGQRTAIVDLDLQFGDVALCMGLPPDTTIYDLALAGGTIDAEKLDPYLVTHASGARVLLAPNRPDQAGSITVPLLQDVYRALRSEFDFIVVDTPPGFTPEVITTIDVSTDLVMVGMLDSLSLKNTKLGLETLDLMGYDPTRIQLVLNRAQSRVGISQSDVAAVLGREPDVLVPSDREIPRAINEGIPIVLAQPDSEAAKAFGALAEMYAGGAAAAIGAAGATSAAAKHEQRISVFGRLAGRKA